MRTSRRWLVASVGASTMGLAAAEDERRTGRPTASTVATSTPTATPTPVPAPTCAPADPCGNHAKNVGVSDEIDNGNGDKKKKIENLFSAFKKGLNYAGAPALEAKILRPTLRDAYHELVPEVAMGVDDWAEAVLQAHILGQLTRFFWQRNDANPDPDDLHPRHLARAWAAFGRATSSTTCCFWVKGYAHSRNAYVLPLRTILSPTGGEVRISQLDQPCPLCG